MRRGQVRNVPVGDLVALLAVTLMALGLRVITAGLFGAGISTDEYRYALVAQDWLASLRGPPTDLVVNHPLVPPMGGIVAALTGLNPLAGGRLSQFAFSLATIPATYLLGRALGLSIGGSLSGASFLAVMPGHWEASVSFLPDPQAALFSTVAILGLVAALHGRAWGMVVSALALGMGFLTKEHLPAVLLPALATTVVLAVTWGAWTPRRAAQYGLALALGLALAITLGATGIGIPRAILLSRAPSGETPLSGLPLTAAAIEDSTRETWLGSATSAVLRLDFGIEWFQKAVSTGVTGEAVTVLGLVGTIMLMLRGARRGRHGLACILSLAVLAAFFAVQLMMAGSWYLLALAAALSLSAAIGPFLRPGEEGRDDGPASARAWSLVGGLGVYLLATLAFFSLRLESVSFLPRMFLPIMPVLAVMAGTGCGQVGGVLALVFQRWPAWLPPLVSGIALAIAIPGGLALTVMGFAVGAAVSLVATRFTPARTWSAIVICAAVAIASGTPTLNTLNRGQEFRGYPNDQYYQQISGGIRVASFRQAQAWLREHVGPSDLVITSKPYQVSWYAGTGFTGFQATRVWDERASDRRRYLSDSVLQSGAYDWIIDFNQFLAQPESIEGPLFEEDYRWLQARSYLQEVFSLHDAEGRILLYAFRHVR